MNIRIGHVPYLNMAPFYHGFGPEPMEIRDRRYEFWSRTPRALGLAAEAGIIDAAPLSLVDALKMENQYEPVGRFGIGVRRSAQSVLLFSRTTMPLLHNAVIAVTDETSTSSVLLQLLLEQHYAVQGIRYERIASAALWDRSNDAMLLIGDEAIKTARSGVPELPIVTDLGEEWYRWQGLPFVFARWMVRSALPEDVKEVLEQSIEKSLSSNELNRSGFSFEEGIRRGTSPTNVQNYWDGFIYRLSPQHLQSIRLFSDLVRKKCLIA